MSIIMQNINYKPKFFVDSYETRKTIAAHQIGDGINLVIDNSNSKGNIVDKNTGKIYLDFLLALRQCHWVITILSCWKKIF